jgi:hypothetical protein
MADDQTTGALPLGSDGQPFCICTHERQMHFGDRLGCHGECHCENYEPSPVAGQTLHHCPQCTDMVINLDEHLTTCSARKADPLDEARSLLAEHERQQDEACRAEIEQVLSKYGRKLIVTQPQITIVPM